MHNKNTLIIGIIISILANALGADGQIGINNAVRLNSPEIFWLKRPLRIQAGSTQYLYLPIPGGEGLDQVRNFKYILDLPKGFELVNDLRLIGFSCFGENGSIYPTSVRTIDGDKNITRYELGIPWIGYTGVNLWLSSPYIPVISISGTGGQWQDFHGDVLLPSAFNKEAVWVMRWSNPERVISSCRGVVDVDDIVVRRKSSGQVVFEEHFNDAYFGQFKGGQKNGVSMEKENGNYFVRIKTGDAEAKIQQSIVAVGANAPGLQSMTPGENYEVACRARAVIARTPDYLSRLPVWIKISREKKAAEISAHYEYEMNGKRHSVPEQKLCIIAEDHEVMNPKSLDVVLWFQAEDCIGHQQNRVQDCLLDLTKSCGIKTYLTELNLNPWQSPYCGNVNKMNLRDPLADKIKQRGMAAIPYLAFLYHNMGFDEYVARHPPAPGRLAINEYVNQFGQTNKAANLYRSCPTRLCDEHDDYWRGVREFLKKAALVNKWDGLMWDFELANILCIPHKMKGKSCFCPICVEEFKKYTGIKDIAQAPEKPVMLEKDYPLQELVGPAREILSNYPLEWLKFKGERNGRICQSMIAAVREINPSARFFLYSGSYQAIPSAEAPWHHCEYYGVYPPAAGRHVDVFMDIHGPLRGKKRGLEEMTLLREALKAGSGRKVKVLNTVGTHSPCYPLAKNDVIQSVALAGADGFQIYSWGGNFDSQTWSSIREGIQILTTFEDFFLDGIRFDQIATLNKPLDYSVWIKGEDRVVFIFNNTNKDEKVTLKNDFRVKYASNRVTAKNYAGEVYTDPEIINCAAPANDTTVISFKAR
ncbi:MAG: hypothetical protein PHV34_02535 [Verrucomicrobiae bacterium]|nr:hypothetical protein [Verrucomicrobiae bacterium]